MKQCTRINGCRLLEPSWKTADFAFCSEVLFINRWNQLGMELNELGIRIDGVKATGFARFKQLLEAVKAIADLNGISCIFYSDELDSKLLNWFIISGFTKTNASETIHYLTYTVR